MVPEHPWSGRKWPGAAPGAAMFLTFGVGCWLLVWMLLGLGTASWAAGASPWRDLDVGFSLAEFEAPGQDNGTQYRIVVARIDPQHYSLVLFSGKEHGRQRLTTRDWGRQYGLLAVINAGMYQADGLTHVSLMKNFKHYNNRRLSKDNTILAFNRSDSSYPEVQIIDRECQDFESLKSKYETLIQGIRMISCDRRNVWSQQSDRWSTAALGMDENGRVLFLFGQHPLSVHDFIEVLLSLPIGIRSTMYLEGGPQASMHISINGVEVDKKGSLESTVDDSESVPLVFPIPNVIGVVRKSRP
ncbi:MAG TPA: hypothetical protein DCE18_15045 [Syntrophobacteraceae bacterium]|jgi:hypothetical protein|nr:hypothetical protein [Syntrophobacteraceae bacterium]HBZ57400.1 hypothetical protein [Syntrophobacteraceae bacterium]